MLALSPPFWGYMRCLFVEHACARSDRALGAAEENTQAFSCGFRGLVGSRREFMTRSVDVS